MILTWWGEGEGCFLPGQDIPGQDFILQQIKRGPLSISSQPPKWGKLADHIQKEAILFSGSAETLSRGMFLICNPRPFGQGVGGGHVYTLISWGKSSVAKASSQLYSVSRGEDKSLKGEGEPS